jgi:hypothetical protein
VATTNSLTSAALTALYSANIGTPVAIGASRAPMGAGSGGIVLHITYTNGTETSVELQVEVSDLAADLITGETLTIVTNDIDDSLVKVPARSGTVVIHGVSAGGAFTLQDNGSGAFTVTSGTETIPAPGVGNSIDYVSGVIDVDLTNNITAATVDYTYDSFYLPTDASGSSIAEVFTATATGLYRFEVPMTFEATERSVRISAKATTPGGGAGTVVVDVVHVLPHPATATRVV